MPYDYVSLVVVEKQVSDAFYLLQPSESILTPWVINTIPCDVAARSQPVCDLIPPLFTFTV
jgi:hypothetical protein